MTSDAKLQNYNFLMLLRLENTGPSSGLKTTVMKQLRAETVFGRNYILEGCFEKFYNWSQYVLVYKC